MFHSASRLLACATVVAIGAAGCSGNRSMLPAAGLQGAGSSARAARLPHPGLMRLTSQPPDVMQMAFLMTDGSVLAQSYTANLWYRYVPDQFGNYGNGTWTQVASLQAGYAPSAFSSAVLADGRLAIIGGEYNTPGNYQLQLTNLGAIYDL
ncbi:MAG TPA: hypothetical protein VGF86_12040, partial [Candidatus Tumulicola sp.]